MKSNLIYIILLIFISTACSCSDKNKTAIENKDSLQNKNGISIDLDSLNPVKIINFKEGKQHKVFAKASESDSVFIDKNIYGIKKGKYFIPSIDEYHGDRVLSEYNLFHNNNLIFRKDSILDLGKYEFIKEKNLATFSIIKDQNDDNFSVTSDLYLVDFTNNKTQLIKEDLTNSFNAPFSINKDVIIYMDESKLYKYNYKTKESSCLITFENNYVIYNIKIINTKQIKLVLFKDITENELYEVNINLNSNLFE